jgi:hypothetical protein
MENELHPQPIANEAVPEIVVTPEMIRAGERVVAAFDRRFDSRSEMVRDVFKAMLACRRTTALR